MDKFAIEALLLSYGIVAFVAFYIGERGWKGVQSDILDIKSDVSNIKTKVQTDVSKVSTAV
jgi:hypothetical protein